MNTLIEQEIEFPLVSVLIPTYNGEEYVAEALFSVIKQTYPNMEIVITDDASQDNTINTIKRFKDEHDYQDQIKLILNTKNQGIPKNMNRWLEECSGKYVSILDQDDEWTSLEKIEEQVKFLEQNKSYGIIGTQRNIFYKGKNITSLLPQNDDEIRRLIIKTCPFQHSTVMYNKTIAEDIGGYDPSYSYAMDLDFFYKMLNQCKGSNLDIYSTIYRLHGNSTSLQFNTKQQREALAIRYKYKETYPLNYGYSGMQIIHGILSQYRWDNTYYQRLKNYIKNKAL